LNRELRHREFLRNFGKIKEQEPEN